MAVKEQDFLSDMLAPPAEVGMDPVVAVFPGMAASSAALEEFERAYFANPWSHLPIPFEEENGDCDRLGTFELQQIADFNATFGASFSENDWRVLNGFEPLTEKDAQP